MYRENFGEKYTMPTPSDQITSSTAEPILSQTQNRAAQMGEIGSHNIREKWAKLNSDYYLSLQEDLILHRNKSNDIKQFLETKNNFYEQHQNATVDIIDRDFRRYEDLTKSTEFKNAARLNQGDAQKVLQTLQENHSKTARELNGLHQRQLSELKALYKDGEQFKSFKDNQGNVIKTAEEVEQLYREAVQKCRESHYEQLKQNSERYKKLCDNFVNNIYNNAPMIRALMNHHNYHNVHVGADLIKFDRDDYYRNGDVPNDFENKWFNEKCLGKNNELQQRYEQGDGSLIFVVKGAGIFEEKRRAELMYKNEDGHLTCIMKFPDASLSVDDKTNTWIKAVPHMVGSGKQSFNLVGLEYYGKDNVLRFAKEILKHNPGAQIKVSRQWDQALMKLKNEAPMLNAAWRKKNGLGDGGPIQVPQFTMPPKPERRDPQPPTRYGIQARPATDADQERTITIQRTPGGPNP